VRNSCPILLFQLPLNLRYKRGVNGELIIEKIGNFSLPFEARFYGPDEEERFGFVVKGRYPQETFAQAIKSTEPRESLPVEYEVKGIISGSHGNDRDHTSFPGSPYTSNRDPLNITATGPAYNEKIRRAFSQSMGFKAYGEIALYDKSPRFFRQREHLRKGKWSDYQTVAMASGFIAKGIGVNQNWIYYFPENILEHPGTVSLYERLYATEERYADVVRKFEIQNAAHLFQTFIFDDRRSQLENQIDFYQSFYKAVNLHISFSSLNNSLAFLQKIRTPFAWHGTRGLTPEQVRKMVTAAHVRNLSRYRLEERETILVSYTPWNNFQLPKSTAQRLEWEDVPDNLIPTPLSPHLFTPQDIERFRRYISERLFEEAVKSPLATTRIKMGMAELYIQEGNMEKAAQILNLAYPQLHENGEISESLWLFKIYCDYFAKLPLSYIHEEQSTIERLRLLVEHQKTRAFIEERLEIKDFNKGWQNQTRPSPFTEGLEQIRSITPDTSKIIKNKWILPEEVEVVRNMIHSATGLQEFSLKDAIFLARVDADGSPEDNICFTTVETVKKMVVSSP
jgi:hypothetical protein